MLGVMEMEFDEIIETAVAELTELCLQRQREEDAEMDALVLHRVDLSSQAVKALEDMDESTRQLFKDYLDVMEDIHGGQIERLYLQGAKDCVQILKKLGVL